MNNHLITFNGCVANLKMIPTQRGRTMVVFSVGDKSCKAFGEFADVCAKLNGAHAEITQEIPAERTTRNSKCP